jgi:hypothetical protein
MTAVKPAVALVTTLSGTSPVSEYGAARSAARCGRWSAIWARTNVRALPQDVRLYRSQCTGQSEGSVSLRSIPGEGNRLSSGLKWQELEVDHSPQSSAQTKNAWSYTSNPLHA